MVERALNSDRSIGAAVAELAVLSPRGGIPTQSAWCQARSRLPEGLLGRLVTASRQQMEVSYGCQHLFKNRMVFVFDGSTLSMSDLPPLVERFGYHKTRHGKSRFPVAKFAIVLRAGVQSVWDWRLDDCRTSEDRQFHLMWNLIPNGSICLFDRQLGSFYNLAKLAGRGIDSVTRLHQRRDPYKLLKGATRIGADDWLVTLRLSAQTRKRYADAQLPEELRVRLIRVRFRRGGRRRESWLVTTLLDPNVYPREELMALYRGRWGIETVFDCMKTTLGLNVLRGRSVGSVNDEVASTILAHNLLWMLIHQAAHKVRLPAWRISFTAAARAVTAFSAALQLAAPGEWRHIHQTMVAYIATQVNRYRPNRTEPRLVKRDPVRYEFLRISRPQATRKCLS
jgi:hypothetical protein